MCALLSHHCPHLSTCMYSSTFGTFLVCMSLGTFLVRMHYARYLGTYIVSCVYVSWHNSSTYMQVSWHISCMYVSWHISSMLRKHMCAGICHISYMQASIWYISCTWQIFLYISKCLGKQSTLEEPFKSTVSMTAYWIYAGMA